MITVDDIIGKLTPQLRPSWMVGLREAIREGNKENFDNIYSNIGDESIKDLIRQWWQLATANNMDPMLSMILGAIPPRDREAARAYFNNGNLDRLQVIVDGIADLSIQDAFFDWRQASRSAPLAPAASPDDPMYTMIRNALGRDEYPLLRDYFKDEEYDVIQIIVDKLHMTIQDAFFDWLNEKKTAQKPAAGAMPLPEQSKHPAVPPKPAPRGNGNQAPRFTATGKPLKPGQRQFEEIGAYGDISMEGYEALKRASKRIKQAEIQYDCQFYLQAKPNLPNPSYRVHANSKDSILQLNLLAIQLLSPTQLETWKVHDFNLRRYIENLPIEERVEVQMTYRVYITPEATEIRGWELKLAIECFNSLNHKYHEANGQKPPVPIKAYNRIPRGGMGGGHRGSFNMGNRAPYQQHYQQPANGNSAAPVQKAQKQNEPSKDLLKMINMYPDEMNILLLGESGSGKSTFINGVVNYVKHGSIENAMKEGVEVAIRSSFSLSQNGNSVMIPCEPTLFSENSKNEVLEAAKSCTQDPKAYVFRFTVQGNKKLIRFIDTPGILDTDGAAKDEENFDKILKHITRFKELSAICILMNSNQSRLTATFKYCIDELLVHLHEEATRNILFCFTNCGDTFNGAGDTISTLQAHLDQLEEKRDVRIPIGMHQKYRFDNSAFRFLCAKKRNWKFQANDLVSNTQMWNRATDETFRLLNHIAGMQMHSVQKTLSLNNARNALVKLSRPLVELTKQLAYNSSHLRAESNRLERLIADNENLAGKLVIKKMILLTEELDYPMTVCAHEKCVETVDEDGFTRTVFSQKCHTHCYLTGVDVNIFPNPILQNCAAMGGQPNCTQCGCPWQTHTHIRYNTIRTTKEMESEDVKRKIAMNETEEEIARSLIKEAMKQAAEAERDLKQIEEYSSMFAIFLKKKSILPYGDSYLDYINYLIKEERGKTLRGGSDKCLNELEESKIRYQERVKRLQEVDDTDDSNVLTVREVNRKIQDLMNLSSCREYLAEVQKLELLSLDTEITENDHEVPLENSWLTRNLD